MTIMRNICLALASCAAAASASSEEDRKWWQELSHDDASIYASYYEDNWFADLNEDKKSAYSALVRDILDFIKGPSDSHEDDSYNGFAPMLLRTSFHSAGTYHKGSGTGGSHGGTLRHDKELADGQNGCIEIGAEEIKALAANHDVTVADAIVIAGSVSLGHMDFPRMDLIKILGGRHDYHDIVYRDRLPSADDDPMTLFTKKLGFTNAELVALIGGAHNFGAAHGMCSGYNGQWSNNPLSWFDADGNSPDFFVNLMRDDWQWFELSTYNNNTVTYKSVPSPFLSTAEEEEEESDDVTLEQLTNEEPIKVETQAMRGTCEVVPGNYPAKQNPCDGDLIFRLRADFFLRMNPVLEKHAQAFADDDELFAELFGQAYHKLTHLGLDRCGMSGHGCNGRTSFCNETLSETGNFLYAKCDLSRKAKACAKRASRT
eukprot:CFRG7288T1